MSKLDRSPAEQAKPLWLMRWSTLRDGYGVTDVKKACVYVDGFNFYHGAVKGTAFKWLDFTRFAEALLRGHSIETVKYFTSRVDDRPDDPGQSQRQDVYLRALQADPRLEIHYGFFRTRKKRVRLVKARSDGSNYDNAFVTEEKATDVAIGAHLVRDALVRPNELEVAMVISNDSDLQCPIDMAVEAGVEVIVVNPHRHGGHRNQLRGSDVRNVRLKHLRDSQLPVEVFSDDGRTIRRPNRWA